MTQLALMNLDNQLELSCNIPQPFIDSRHRYVAGTVLRRMDGTMWN